MTDTKDTVSLFVPGRLCLFGEHSDWAAEFGLHRGFCLVIGTDQGLSATARPARDFTVETILPDNLGRPSGRRRTMSCPWTHDALTDAAQDQDEFFRYCAGTACQMHALPQVAGGLCLRINTMDLPLRKGVSSSAAVCILVAKAFDLIYRLGLFPHEMMELAYMGERVTGSQCGRMDQACIYGKTPVLLTFAAKSPVRVEPIFPHRPIFLFFVDLAGRKNTVRILEDLRQAYSHNTDVREALGAANERIVREAFTAIEEGDDERLGRLMTQSQQNFDRLLAPSCPEELSAPLLHQLLNMQELQPLIYGGKTVGSGGDGTAQFVARSQADRHKAMSLIAQRFPQMQCFPLTIEAIGRSGGAPA